MKRGLVTVGLFVGAVFLVFRWLLVSEIEHGGRHRSTFSPASAASYGLLVKRLTLDPSYFVIGRDTARIIEAWIEKGSRIRCSIVFGTCTREPTAGYFEALRMDRSPGWRDMGFDIHFVEADSIAYWSLVGMRDSGVSFRDINQPLPDSLRLSLCEYKSDRDGGSLSGRHRALPDCRRS